MVLKQAITAITMAFLLISAQASPVNEEQLELCKVVAENYQSGVQDKQMGLSQSAFEGQVMMFAMHLIQKGLPEDMIKMLVQPILDGYHGKSSAKAHFQGCMSLNI